MSDRRLPPPYVLALGILGLLTMLVAFIVETAMGSGGGHRYLVVHAVQLAGAGLVVLFALLTNKQRKTGRR